MTNGPIFEILHIILQNVQAVGIIMVLAKFHEHRLIIDR